MKKTYIKPSATTVALQIEDAILTLSGGEKLNISTTEKTNAAFSESKGWGWNSDSWTDEE